MTKPPAGPVILKFGGTSVADAERIRHVADLVAARADLGPVVVVVSAMSGVTNALEAALGLAARGDPGWREALDALERRHREAVAALAEAGTPARAALDQAVDRIIGEELSDLLHGASLLREASPRTRDTVRSTGERLSSRLVARAIEARGRGSQAVDARTILVSDQRFGNARVLVEPSRPRVRETLGPLLEAGVVPVVTGFLASTVRGETSTLGRGGSDYTASVLGQLLGADLIEIWTDVDGVMTADPRVVPRAFTLPSLSYAELMELSHFGARVVYPPTVAPAREAGIPLRIRNTLNPEAPGTLVHDGAAAPDGPIRGIASLPRCALLRLEGDGMPGVPGIAERLFGALARRSVSVILISQASSERSICFALEPDDVDPAREAVEEAFALEMEAGLVNPLVVEEDAAIVAVVGEGMRETPALPARLFSVLGSRSVNVRAIAQGSSELNISLVIHRDHEGPALRAIHDAFFFPGIRRARLHLAGTGRVGGALLARLAGEFPRLRAERGIHLALDGLVRLEGGIVAESMDPASWEDRVAEGGADLEAVVEAALASPRRPVIFVDTTASDAPVAHYARLLRGGVSVVTANRRGAALPQEAWEALRRAAAPGAGLYVEATVGAGLPLLRTLADLVATGDRVLQLEGVLSGTLSQLLADEEEGVPLEARVRRAWEAGVTERDPLEDLLGTDTARKLVILARAAGIPLEPESVAVEPFLSAAAPENGEGAAPWLGLAPEAILARLAVSGEGFLRREAEARARGHRLRYLARVRVPLESGEAGPVTVPQAQVGFVEVGPSHPAWRLPPGDNLVSVTSRYHRETPLVIRGPGAGPEVAASGVLADILRAVLESR